MLLHSFAGLSKSLLHLEFKPESRLLFHDSYFASHYLFKGNHAVCLCASSLRRAGSLPLGPMGQKEKGL